MVCDQIGAPTWSQDIAESTVKILRDLASASLESRSGEWLSHVSRNYHLTAGGETTWHGFASAIIEEAAKIAVEVPWVSAITQGKPLDHNESHSDQHIGLPYAGGAASVLASFECPTEADVWRASATLARAITPYVCKLNSRCGRSLGSNTAVPSRTLNPN